MQYYVYVHFRPNGDPFYVGKGCGRRAYDFDNRRNKYYKNIVNSVGKSNVKVELFMQDSEIGALQKEVKLIRMLRTAGYKLSNITDGGEGSSGMVTSAETKHKQSLAKLGKPLTAEHRRRIGAANLGRKHVAGYAARLSAILKGLKRSPEIIARMVITSTGRTHTVEAKAKIGAAQRGKHKKAEAIAAAWATRRANKYKEV